jgi:hypothetical protein
MKSYEVVETLRKSRKAVFTPKDIAKITGFFAISPYSMSIRNTAKGNKKINEWNRPRCTPRKTSKSGKIANTLNRKYFFLNSPTE